MSRAARNVGTRRTCTPGRRPSRARTSASWNGASAPSQAARIRSARAAFQATSSPGAGCARLKSSSSRCAAPVSAGRPAAPAAQRDVRLAAALARAGLADAGCLPLLACLAAAAGAPRPAGLAAAWPRVNPVPVAPQARHPVARRVQQACAAQDPSGGAGEPGQDTKHGVVDERLAIGFPHGQRQAKHRAHGLLPPLPVLVFGRIGRQHRLAPPPPAVIGEQAAVTLAGEPCMRAQRLERPELAAPFFGIPARFEQEPVALVAQRIDDASDLDRRHAFRSRPASAGPPALALRRVGEAWVREVLPRDDITKRAY
jgi:hypothetical protein